MSEIARSAVVEKSHERIVVVDILKQQMLELQALRKAVSEAERHASVRGGTRP
jgi:hypothetical protein